jgi:hypothetical protein
MRGLTIALVLVAALGVSLGIEGPAIGQDCSTASETGTNTFVAMGECHSGDASDGAPQVTGAAEPTGSTTYSYEPACVRGEGITRDDFYGCDGQLKCGRNDKGKLFHAWAHHPDGSDEYLGEQCFEPDEAPVAPTPQVTQALVLRAFERIPVPASRVSIQPPGGKTLVNLETIFSTQAREFTRTIGLLGHRVDLEIWPSRFEWVTGDGADFATDWAGRPWEKGVPLGEFITHIYDDAQGVTTRVDTTWSARYRVDGGSWNDVGGTVTIEGEPFDLAVLSAEPHLVG